MKIICDPGLLIGTLLQMFFCEFYEIFKATFLTDDCRNNLFQMFYKICVLKDFTKVKGKYLCRSLLFNNVVD